MVVVRSLLAVLASVAAAYACELPHRHVGATKAATSGYWAGPAVSGAWFDPARSGEGVIVQFLADGRALAIWFTYPTSGEAGDQAWLLAQEGVVDGDTLRFASVIRPQGARFGAAFDPAAVRFEPWGTLELRFANCSEATLSWSGAGAYGSGSRALSRLSSLNELDCGGARALTASGGRSLAGLRSRSGAWYVPERSGEGWLVEDLPDGQSLVYWFTYDPQGRQAWMLGLGRREDQRIVIDDLRITRGTRFGSDFNAAAVERVPWGQLELNFQSCGSAELRYTSSLAAYGSATRSTQRLTMLAGVPCIESPTSLPANLQWAERARTPAPAQSELATTTLDGALYALGGFGDPRGFRRLDVAGDRWTELPDLPGGRDHASAFAVPGFVYLVGGAVNGAGDQQSGAFRYDLARGAWESVSEISATFGSNAAALHGQIYLGDVSAGLQQFNPRTRQVRTIARPDFQDRDHAQVLAYLDEIWVIAGRSPETTRVAIYNPASGRWRDGPSIRSPRGGFAAAVVGDRIVLTGGEVLERGIYVEGSTEIYTAGSSEWQAGPDLPVPVHGVSGVAVGSRFIIVSGSVSAGLATGATGRVYELNLQSSAP